MIPTVHHNLTRALEDALALFAEAAVRVPAASLDRRCLAGWTVRDLIDHTLRTGASELDEVIDLDGPMSMFRMCSERRDVDVDAIVGEDVLEQRILEVVVHTLDLAVTTGVSISLPDHLESVTLEILGRSVTMRSEASDLLRILSGRSDLPRLDALA